MISAMESFEEELSSLSEMFPECDENKLRGYLEMFKDDPNHMTSIINMLLENGNTDGTHQNQEQTSSCERGLKRSANTGEDSLPRKVSKCDFSRKNENELTSATRMACTSKSSFSLAKNHQPSRKHDFLDHKTSSTSDDDDIVLVKSVASSPKPGFYRSSGSDSGISSPQKSGGICIRYKGGALHPSMNKSKRSQIVEIDCDDSKDSKSHSLSSQSPARRSLSASKHFTSATEISQENNDDLPRYETSAGATPHKKDNASSSSQSQDKNQVEVVSSSGNSSHSSVAEVLTDLEILKKVFPDSDHEYIDSLLHKYADQPNRVALVGKELSSKPDSQSVKKKMIETLPWFWQTEEGKLVPFTDSECNFLEKEYIHCDTSHSSTASVKVRMPGSTKTYDLNFAGMTMTCDKGQKTLIIRAPLGSDNNKQIGGKNLVPQEALSLPPDWQQQIENVQLISVRPGSAEWDHIQRSLKRSLREAQVTNVQRVQNKWLYRKYAIQRHLIKDKNGFNIFNGHTVRFHPPGQTLEPQHNKFHHRKILLGSTCINEKELFHGTRHTNPDVIWKGEDGFDMRHSADGMWGRGTYFASEASYCHRGFVYYDPKKKHFQLFLAHVLTGDSISLPPNKEIRMPPPKRGSDIRYDSINGITNGCTVYITYKLDMAYPAYLITYTISN